MKLYLLDVVNPSSLSDSGYAIHSFLLYAHNYNDAHKRALDVCPEDNVLNIYELDPEEINKIIDHIYSVEEL